MSTKERRTGLMALAWIWVGVPFAYGVYELFLKLTQLFSG
ncbi:MFS transporter small subunit [[Actinomadura] parvosata]